jgi:Ca2+-binding EF-hand superfamily protein
LSFTCIAFKKKKSNVFVTRAMANDYLISKWKDWFSLFDADNDGKVCFTDMEKAR